MVHAAGHCEMHLSFGILADLMLGALADTNLDDDDLFDSLGSNMSPGLSTCRNLVLPPGTDFAVYIASFAYSVDTARAPVILRQST